MTASKAYPATVRIVIRQGRSGAWIASSPDVDGFMVMSADRRELEDGLVERYLARLYAAARQPAPAFTWARDKS